MLLLALEAPLGDLATRALFRDPFHVALPARHPLARRRRLREADLAGEPVLLLDDGHCLRAQALAVCREAGAEEQSDFRATQPRHADRDGVRRRRRDAPARARAARARRAAPGLAVRPFAKPEPHRTIGLAWRPSSGRGAEFALLADSLAPRTAD